MDRRRFEALVAEALDALPAKYRALLENVAVVVEDRPSPEVAAEFDDTLLGLFDGVPRTEASVWDSGRGPNRVLLFRGNIEDYAREAAGAEGRPVEEIIREEVRLTVLHELGHYFGLGEEALEDV